MADSDKPGSALEAIEAAASDVEESAPEPEDSSSSDTQEQPQLSADADATSTESATETTDEGTVSPEADTGAKKGPIPFDRHEAVLANARKELEDYKARLAWAEQLRQEDVQRAIQTDQRIHQNPIEFLQMLQREIEAHPHLGPQFKQPQAFQMPEPALQSQDGQRVYSVEQMQQIRDHDLATLRAEFAAQMQQVNAGIEQQAQIEQQRQALVQATNQSSAILAEFRQKPHFTDNEEKITKVYASMSPEEQQRLGPVGGLERAYTQVLIQDVLPSIKKASEKETLTNLKKKAAAVTADPSAAAGADKARPQTQRELEKFIEELATA